MITGKLEVQLFIYSLQITKDKPGLGSRTDSRIIAKVAHGVIIN